MILTTAMAEVGTIDRDRGQITPRVLEYLTAANMEAVGSRPPYWGGAFLAWCAIKSGMVPPVGAGDPAAWERWSDPIAEPIPGCVVVLVGSKPGAAHVGVVVRRHAGRVYVVGGDHGGAVNIQRCEDARIWQVRRPPNIVAQPQPSPQTVDVRVTVDRAESNPSIYSQQPHALLAPDDVSGLRASVVAAIAAAAEARPGDEKLVYHLAELAAIATAATTREGVESARQQALAYIAQP